MSESEIEKKFDACVKIVNTSKDSSMKLSNNDKLMFYALFK